MKTPLAFAVVCLSALWTAPLALGQAGPSSVIVPDSALIGRALWNGGRGYQIAASRGKAVQEVLDIEWKYPVYPRQGEPKKYAGALPLDEAYKELTENDPRPLLVLREFASFEDPGSEKLSLKLYTEKTVLLSHWFRCVRLPCQVMDSRHPFHGLFASEPAPQLFLANPDGSEVVPFDYDSSKADLEKLMRGVLDEHYAQSPAKNLDPLIKVLQKLETLDKKRQELKEKLDRTVENSGSSMSRIRKAEEELKRCDDEYQALKEQRDALRVVPLKTEAGEDQPSQASPKGK